MKGEHPLLAYKSVTNFAGKCRKLERLEIEVTRRCPLRCIHCSTRAGPETSSNDLSFKDIIKVISEFSELGGSMITVTGGEPFIRGIGRIRISYIYKLQTI